MSRLLSVLPTDFNSEVEEIQTTGKAFEPTAARCTCTTVPCCCCWGGDNDVNI